MCTAVLITTIIVLFLEFLCRYLMKMISVKNKKNNITETEFKLGSFIEHQVLFSNLRKLGRWTTALFRLK